MVNLIPMRLAPQERTEILAYHRAGEFQIVWFDTNTNTYKMYWNDIYSQPASKFKGWVHVPVPYIENTQ